MGQGERIGSLTHCPLTPSLKRRLKPQSIKMSLNLNVRPKPIFVVMSLIIILIAVLAFYYAPRIIEYTPGYTVLLVISFAQIITLGAVWKTLSRIIEFSNLKPNSIYVAMILLFILLSGRAYYYTPIIQNAPSLILLISFLELIMLGGIWKEASAIRESNKTKTSFVKTRFARGVDWQWVLIGISFLLLVLVVVLHLQTDFLFHMV